jgi:hypothetical protein
MTFPERGKVIKPRPFGRKLRFLYFRRQDEMQDNRLNVFYSALVELSVFLCDLCGSSEAGVSKISVLFVSAVKKHYLNVTIITN